MSVRIEKCETYSPEEVSRAIDLIMSGVQHDWTGETVLLKANLVSAISYEKAATTHPEVVRALAQYLFGKGAARVIIGDSPGGPYTKAYLLQVYGVTGMKKVAESTGAELNYDFSHVVTDYDGYAVSHMEIIKVFEEADSVINVAKLKTHELTGFTGAVKNYFGLIPGLIKVQYHGQNADIDKFSDLLIDIQRYAKGKTVCHIVDGIVGMEGPGPTSGTPRKIGAVLMSDSPYEVDAACMKLIGLDAETVPYMRRALSRGETDSVDYDLGEYSELAVGDYKTVKLKKSILPINWMPERVRKYVERHITRHPKINKKKCKGCGKCEKHCPPRAITITEGKATVNYNKCIRCFCCQELCPFHVIKVVKPFLYRILKF
ncbi:MAG: DUF362 domain-containing protein [Christensenellales bacterium]